VSSETEFQNSQFSDSGFPGQNRRSSDVVLATILKTLQENQGTLVKMEGSINALRQDVESAFPRDSLNKPDFAGHRMAHDAMKVSAGQLRDYKVDFTKNLLRLAAGGAIVITLLGVDAYIKARSVPPIVVPGQNK